MLENSGIWRVDESGNPYGGGYPNPMVCYNNPLTVIKYSEYIKQCSENGIKGILIDEPTIQDCFCEHCRSKSRQFFGDDLLKIKKTDLYSSFQFKTTMDFVEQSSKAIKEIDKNMEVSVCVMPVDINIFKHIAKIDSVDCFSTDPYWLRPVNNLSIKKAIEVSNYCKKLARKYDKVFSLFLGCFGIESGLEEKIYTEGKLLVDSTKPDILTTWSYRGGIGLSNLSDEECDNPELAWQNVLKLYQDYSKV